MNILLILALAAFLACSIADILATTRESGRTERAVKPLLMPLLLCCYLLGAAVLGKSPNVFLIPALVFGFLGDTFLLGTGIYFICGLAAFLAGHLCYIAVFLRPLNYSAVPLAAWLAVLVYIGYGAAVCRTLLPDVPKKDRMPVILYMLCLLAMSFSALLRCGYASGAAFWLPFAGSLFFVASDSLLAFRIYRKSGGNSGPAVMVTYLLAQAMIAGGMLL